MFLLSPSKTLSNTNKKGSTNILFKDKNNYIFNKIIKLNKDDLKSYFKVSNKKIDLIYDYYHDNNYYEAIDLFTGILYKVLNKKIINNDNLLILDSYYGLIRPFDNIKKYYLDFNTNLIDYKYWETEINNYLSNLKELIIDLSSKEYSKLLNIDKLNYLRIDFINYNSNVELKRLRGLMTNYLIENNINNLKDRNKIKNIKINDYIYDDINSNNKLIIFKKA